MSAARPGRSPEVGPPGLAVGARGRLNHERARPEPHGAGGPGAPVRRDYPSRRAGRACSPAPLVRAASRSTPATPVSSCCSRPPNSAAFTESQRARLVRRLAEMMTQGQVSVVASEHRLQLRNRIAARDRLVALLREAVAPPPPPRRKTKPSRASQRRRVETKKQAGRTKALRGRVRDERRGVAVATPSMAGRSSRRLRSTVSSTGAAGSRRRRSRRRWCRRVPGGVDLPGAAGRDDAGEAVGGHPAVAAEAELADVVAVVGLGAVVVAGQGASLWSPVWPGGPPGS